MSMSENKVHCQIHGEQDIALMCSHLIESIESGKHVGFFTEDSGDLGRPDAWCKSCEDSWPNYNGDSAAWTESLGFRVACCSCWDIAKEQQAK